MVTCMVRVEVTGQLDLEIDPDDLLNLADVLLPTLKDAFIVRGKCAHGDLFVTNFKVNGIDMRAE